MNKTKTLTKTELEAKMWRVLLHLHTNHSDLKFHVYDERDDNPESDEIIVRSSFILNGNEFADVTKIDGNIPNKILGYVLDDLGEALEVDKKRKIKKNG